MKSRHLTANIFIQENALRNGVHLSRPQWVNSFQLSCLIAATLSSGRQDWLVPAISDTQQVRGLKASIPEIDILCHHRDAASNYERPWVPCHSKLYSFFNMLFRPKHSWRIWVIIQYQTVTIRNKRLTACTILEMLQSVPQSTYLIFLNKLLSSP